MRFTENRKNVLNVLKNAKRPITAEEIDAEITKELDLSTIYRALNFLEENQFISSASFGKNIRFFFCEDKFNHFLYCEKCSKIEVFNDCFAQKLKKKLNKQYNFQIESHILYFRGICNACKQEEEL